MLKSISSSVIFKEHPEVENELWGGEFGKMDILPERSERK